MTDEQRAKIDALRKLPETGLHGDALRGAVGGYAGTADYAASFVLDALADNARIFCEALALHAEAVLAHHELED